MDPEGRAYSRMRSRRVPVLRLGSRGPGGDARSLRLGSQASASVRKRSQAFASVRGGSDMPEGQKSSRNAELSSLLDSSISKVATVTGIGGSWSRNAELSSLLDSSRLFASQKCQQSQGSKRRTVVTFGLVSSLRISKASTVTGIGGVVVAKRRTVVTFGLASGERKGERRKER